MSAMSLTELAKRARALFNFERTFVCAVLLIVSWQLFFPPVLGLADNGDYARLMVHFDLTHAATDWGERYFGFIDRHYLVNAVEARKYSIPGFISSEMIFVGVASGVGRALGSTSFDLLYLGAVHVLALAASVFLLLLCTRAFVSRTRTIALILGTVVFTDIAYIAYFNSFYSESATLLFFV